MNALKKAGSFLLDLFDLVMDIFGMFSDAKKSVGKQKKKKRRK
ncbi:MULTISPECIES: hypothetical protein [unclassified Ruminococcus]|nr:MULTISPECIES: hypothetical protein [unclassified Ruminococcus]